MLFFNDLLKFVQAKYVCMQTWKERDGEWRLVKFLTF